MTERLDLTQTTFIIPLCIESEDRAQNAEIVLSYLCKHLKTNIIIYEYDKGQSKLTPILEKIDLGEIKLDHWFVENKTGNKTFDRTRFLNEMTVSVKTPVVVNYDIDILMEPKSYEKCQEFILGGHDLIYPYFWGDSQWQVYKSGREKIKQTLTLDSLNAKDKNLTRSEFGHLQFFKKSSYFEGGLENENFLDWGPEDQERGYRFKKLGYVVVWSSFYVYHIEHSRTSSSSQQNPYFKHNVELFEKIKKMSKEELRSYCDNVDYMKKYKDRSNAI